MKPRVIALASLKGGCGKSTLAWNLAAGLARREKAGLLDCDPQGTLRHWAAWSDDADAPEVLAGGAEPLEALSQAARQWRRVVVDCPPSLERAITGQILERVDAVLIPVLPSPLDLWAGADTVAALTRARTDNPGLQAWLVLNQMEPASALSRAMSEALASLEVPTLAGVVRRRAVYRTAAVEGRSVYQLGARGREAAREMDQLIEEVFGT